MKNMRSNKYSKYKYISIVKGGDNKVLKRENVSITDWRGNKRNRDIKTISLSNKKQIRQFVLNSYKALPKQVKKVIDADGILENIINQINAGVELSPYISLTSYYRHRTRGTETIRDIYRRFRTEDPSLYAKYNSYMYRQGYSSAQYFYENGEITQQGSTVICTVNLPLKLSGVIYEELVITYDYSSTDFWAEMN